MTNPAYLTTGVTLVHTEQPSTWHALRAAYPGGRIVTTCVLELPYARVNVMVVRPGERLPHNTCPACRRHVEIAMHGASVPVEAVAVTRTSTPNLRGARIRAATLTGVARTTTQEQEWCEGGVPEMVMAEMTSKAVMR